MKYVPNRNKTKVSCKYTRFIEKGKIDLVRRFVDLPVTKPYKREVFKSCIIGF